MLVWRYLWNQYNHSKDMFLQQDASVCFIFVVLAFIVPRYAKGSDVTAVTNFCRGCPRGRCHNYDESYSCVVDCNPGFYGRSCQYLCPSQCVDGTCDKLLGTCFGCMYGFYGIFCNLTCSNGCNTRSEHKCDQNTGHCLGGCHLGFYGQRCDKTCPDQCYFSCNRNDGSCFGCDSRYWGTFCNHTCASNCFLSCEQNTGICSICNPGWRGAQCDQPCSLPNCKECTINDECFSCVGGWFGLRCDQKCSPYCQSTSCDRRTGNCNCQKGWFGEQCKNQCIPHCALCSCNETCTICDDGYYGAKCEHRCNVNCKTCLRSGLKCTRCQNEDMFGEKCSCSYSECVERKKSKFDCIRCDRDNWFPFGNGCCPCSESHCMNSISECNSYSSPTCPKGCEAGYYGVACTKKCSPHCKGGNSTCSGDFGHCAFGCSDQWYGKKCEASYCVESYPHCTKCSYRRKPYAITRNDLDCIECEAGYYITNAQCEKCLNCENQRCRSHDGICLEGCTEGWYLDIFREYCTRKCGHCINNLCYAFNGTCIYGCLPGYYGHECNLHCPRNCMSGICNSSGVCSEGCIKGFYGRYCYKECERCMNDLCDQESGLCKKCQPQWHGPDCNLSCDGCAQGVCTDGQGCTDGCWPGIYGNYCDMFCPDKISCYACDQLSGQCIVCKDNVELQLPPSCRIAVNDVIWAEAFRDPLCPNGSHGIDCSTKCPSNCETSRCDRYTGTCLLVDDCKPGYFGMFCDRICSNCLNDECSRQSGKCLYGCATGWKGSECLVKLQSEEITDVSVMFAVVAVLGAVGMGLIVMLVVYICCTPRKDPKEENYIPTEAPVPA